MEQDLDEYWHDDLDGESRTTKLIDVLRLLADRMTSRPLLSEWRVYLTAVNPSATPFGHRSGRCTSCHFRSGKCT